MDMRDRLITIFGGAGFIGRYTVRALAKTGARLRIACRDPRDAYALRPQAAMGQIQAVRCDITNPAQVARALEDSWGTVNLVGILAGDFERFHVTGAWNVAQAAAAAKVQSLVQVSAIGADPQSASAYGRSKGEGERVVREAFPGATILRPSIVFGPEDGFINRFARLIRLLPVVPVIRGPAKFQPVYVGDVAQAIAIAVTEPQVHGGQTYELGGPQVRSMAELNRMIADVIGRPRPFLPVPDAVAGLMARATGWAPGAPITPDQFAMLQVDNVARGPGLAELGVVPTPLEAVVEGWLVQYRRQGRFAARGR